MADIETKIIEYTLKVNAVFGRNRKAKREWFRLARRPAESPMSDGEVIALAAERLASERVKAGGLYRVEAAPVTVCDRGGGFVSELRRLFDPEERTILSGVAA